MNDAILERDEIMDEYYRLSLLNIIPDMHQYGMDWQRLALKCDIEGRVSTAETCRKNAAHYWELAGGEYIRLVEGCFAELVPVDVVAVALTAGEQA